MTTQREKLAADTAGTQAAMATIGAVLLAIACGVAAFAFAEAAGVTRWLAVSGFLLPLGCVALVLAFRSPPIEPEPTAPPA